MSSQPQAQPRRLRRLLGGGGGKNLSSRLSLNTSTTFLNDAIGKSSEEPNRRQSMNLFSFTSSPVSTKSSTRSTRSTTADTESELEFMGQRYESISSAESPSVTLNGVAPVAQRNLPARPQSSMSFRKHSNPSFLLPLHTSHSSSSLEVTQSPTSIEAMDAIPENNIISGKFASGALRKSVGDRRHPSLQLTVSQKLLNPKRSLSAINPRSEMSHEPSSPERPSSALFGARKKISALLPDSWKTETTRTRTLTMSSMSHSSDNETSASESPPMTPANPGAQFMQEDEHDDHSYHLPRHKPITPISHHWVGLLEHHEDGYFSEKQASSYEPQPIVTPNQIGNRRAADKQAPPMPFLDEAQSTRSLKSQDEVSFSKRPVNQYLAEQVRLVLGSALTEADMEIEQEWETHREVERQNSLPLTGNYARAVGGLA